MGVHEGLDDGIDDAIGIPSDWKGSAPRFRSESSLTSLAEGRPTSPTMTRNLCARVESNWITSGYKVGTKENWRHASQSLADKKNTSREVVLNRRLTLLMNEIGEDWANEVPVDSGIGAVGTKCAVDLVRRISPTAFELIELKTPNDKGKCDTPLKASVQALQYAAIYLFSRKNAERLGYLQGEPRPILLATEVEVKVLTTAANYRPEWRRWLIDWQQRLDCELRQVAAETVPGLKMSFAFEQFPEGFEARLDESDESIRSAVRGRTPLTAS